MIRQNIHMNAIPIGIQPPGDHPNIVGVFSADLNQQRPGLNQGGSSPSGRGATKGLGGLDSHGTTP